MSKPNFDMDAALQALREGKDRGCSKLCVTRTSVTG